MSKLSFRRALVVSGLIAGTVFGFGLLSGVRPASAGEAGAAGSAAFKIDGATSKVTGAAVSAAVGSNGAAAGSYNDASSNAAYSSGTSGTTSITVTSGIVSGMTTAAPSAVEQVNTLDSSAVQMDADAGTLTGAGSTAP